MPPPPAPPPPVKSWWATTESEQGDGGAGGFRANPPRLPNVLLRQVPRSRPATVGWDFARGPVPSEKSSVGLWTQPKAAGRSSKSRSPCNHEKRVPPRLVDSNHRGRIAVPKWACFDGDPPFAGQPKEIQPFWALRGQPVEAQTFGALVNASVRVGDLAEAGQSKGGKTRGMPLAGFALEAKTAISASVLLFGLDSPLV